MIIKFLQHSATFEGVFYNTDKVDEGRAELTAIKNFDLLYVLTEIRPTDYANYLIAFSARNKGISKPQLHVTLSAKGMSHDKTQLTHMAHAWMNRMGYGKQPYLIFIHKDTANNHIHIVSTRVDQDGRKINSGFERIRGLAALNQIIGVDENQTARQDLEKAAAYRFSNLSQFKLILEKQGYTIKDNDLIKFGKKLAVLDAAKIIFRDPDQHRANQLKAIFKKYSPGFDTAAFEDFMKTEMGVELVFHAKEGKPAYGYTVIDHAQKNIYKGGEIMPLKELTGTQAPAPEKIPFKRPAGQAISSSPDTPVQINIARDVDDEAVHGRRRKKKARTDQR